MGYWHPQNLKRKEPEYPVWQRRVEEVGGGGWSSLCTPCSSGSEESEDRIQTALAVIWKLLSATVRCWGSWRWGAGTRLQVFLKVGLLGFPGGLDEGLEKRE